jgi:Amidohydrolase
MLLQRADDRYQWEAPDTPERPSVAARRMWYDTVGHGHVPALRCAIDSFGADRLLLGTDFPYEAGYVFVRAVQYIADPQIAEDDTNAILERNATALFGMTTPPGASTPWRPWPPGQAPPMPYDNGGSVEALDAAHDVALPALVDHLGGTLNRPHAQRSDVSR